MKTTTATYPKTLLSYSALNNMAIMIIFFFFIIKWLITSAGGRIDWFKAMSGSCQQCCYNRLIPKIVDVYNNFSMEFQIF